MTQRRNDPITKPEWVYLSEDAKALALKLRYDVGVEDIDLAVEIAVLSLGDELAYELE